ncbi:uncharacterized protein BYT42DRAFT_562706 [Radiomyces spectabilis]|uniref:uncharacterized protein n=1 Tax=Radiomyces spectabilis TaxID=64574 RepID=UPI00221FA570|nr:uncharacterized protein BYT42DRAFT_562706 [Radiomyces spectabilis]KAI8384496.1 hypothetical protein BYT42DRAFT_562706 [Radiomyces spectabilis]
MTAMPPPPLTSQPFEFDPLWFEQQQQQQQQQPPSQPPMSTGVTDFSLDSLLALGTPFIPSSIPVPVSNGVPPSFNANNEPPLPPSRAPTSQPLTDTYGQPVKIRKKPGRKPNPASPAIRKAQNRAAQRAFRERKESHLRELENTIRNLREQRTNLSKEVHQLKNKADIYQTENWYLKGIILSLQLVCFQNHVHIPTHGPYLSDHTLAKVAETVPQAIEAYNQTRIRNNANLKPSLASYFASSSYGKCHADPKTDEAAFDRAKESTPEYAPTPSPNPPADSEAPLPDYDIKQEDQVDDIEVMRQRYKNLSQEHNASPWIDSVAALDAEKMTIDALPGSSLAAIQRIRLELRFQSMLRQMGQSMGRLQPTVLQLAIPHDPRIDLIPSPHMRDRMILFRDQMDYDRCFDMLLSGAIFHGGDPTKGSSWELPPAFFSEFWYLTVSYEVRRTNAWRRLKGLPDIEPGPQMEDKRGFSQNTDHKMRSPGMPDLETLRNIHPTQGQHMDFDYTPELPRSNQTSSPLLTPDYAQFARSSPMSPSQPGDPTNLGKSQN